MLDPPTHNRPFADKRDKVGIDCVPKSNVNFTLKKSALKTFTPI